MGKTWILKKFGSLYYENTAYFNFDENIDYKQFFEKTKDVRRIIQNLMIASGQNMLPEKTLIIFDEVQDCPNVINAMKYFCENEPQYHVACAGSFAMQKVLGDIISAYERDFAITLNKGLTINFSKGKNRKIFLDI